MTRWTAPCALLALLIASGAAGCAAAGGPDADDVYQRSESWLCRPDRDDACARPAATTRVEADGTRTQHVWAPRRDAPIDCFYVYPTISRDPRGNSTRVASADEMRAATLQFAPFASVCRPYAPMYRQVTLAGLTSVIGGGSLAVDRALPLQDVRAAWRHYLRYDNHGRGVVLIGHSQGSNVLLQLMRSDIDGAPAQSLLVAALLLGFNVEVPAGATVGGTFQHIPLCTAAAPRGCVASYESFREESPPPPNARFAQTSNPQMQVACTDPTLLSGTPLEMALPTRANLLGQPASAAAWTTFAASVDTPFVSLPGLVRVHCVHDAHGGYLAVSTLDAASGGERPHSIPGDLVVQGRLLPDWGLHLIDPNIALGNLVTWIGAQGRQWAAP